MTAAWTIADLAALTEHAAYLDSITCERCGVVETDEQYCDDCVEDIVNWLLWEEYGADEQWQMQLDAVRFDEQHSVEKGLY